MKQFIFYLDENSKPHFDEGETDIADALRVIADQLEQGYTSGYYPTWEIVEVKEEKKEPVKQQ